MACSTYSGQAVPLSIIIFSMVLLDKIVYVKKDGESISAALFHKKCFFTSFCMENI